jgi:hypothetical protein
VPVDVRRALALVRGETFALLLTVVYPDGDLVPYVATDAYTLRVRPSPSSYEVTATVAGVWQPADGDNVWKFTVPVGTTRQIDAGWYAYDITRVDAAGAVETVLPTSTLRVSAAPVYGG